MKLRQSASAFLLFFFSALLLAPGDFRCLTPDVATGPDRKLTSCTERDLDTALREAPDGASLVFVCSGEIQITSTKTIERRITLDSAGQPVMLRGKGVIFKIAKQGALTLYHVTVSGD